MFPALKPHSMVCLARAKTVLTSASEALHGIEKVLDSQQAERRASGKADEEHDDDDEGGG